jgi:hypothetical protein
MCRRLQPLELEEFPLMEEEEEDGFRRKRQVLYNQYIITQNNPT